MRDAVISVAKDFSPHPGPRYIKQGPFSGQLFRRKLVDALRRTDRVVVVLDGTSGFGSSFLDEAFGGLVRNEGMTADEVRKRVIIQSEQDFSYKQDIEEAIEQARTVAA